MTLENVALELENVNALGRRDQLMRPLPAELAGPAARLSVLAALPECPAA